ncbi:FAD-binding oxidoreductase [Nocardia mexicana]|uniref:FAD/FMN-containing dehydrogenase n=1 Tax=Nocardia mexicana TaxID=279262 RepID=A0A370GZK3_9NOCA|nr:FAD-binding oxidoreductase [Nocardia mexicana]RDI49058.1 FAD/FMN-containing dehydrogenase [Nocardia mexicana]
MNEIEKEFAGRVDGRIHLPETDGYDRERSGFQLLDQHRPGVVVAATGERDIRAAVEVAAERGLPLAVQATGHGLAAPTDGVLISTRDMSGVRVDPRARTAWVQAGATWQHVIDAAAPHGLAPLSGSFPGVGAISYTLGGGVGLLARRYGFAADHVRRIDLVTLDGRSHHVTAESDPDLFWALRGGGGNFGVVTGMEIDLLPVAEIYGGSLYFDLTQVTDLPAAWHRWTAGVPEEMTSAVTMMSFPDLPMLPEPLRGRHVAQVQVSYLGSPRDGAAVVDPLRSAGPILLDTLRERPFTESGAIFDEPDQPHAYRSRNVLVSELDGNDLAGLATASGPEAPIMVVAGLRHLGGALARPPRIPNAVGHREAAYSVSVLSPVDDGERELVRSTHRAALKPFSRNAIGTSLNFTFGPVGEEEIRSAFAPGDFERLAAIASRCDPHGLLRANHPVRPTASPAMTEVVTG